MNTKTTKLAAAFLFAMTIGLSATTFLPSPSTAKTTPSDNPAESPPDSAQPLPSNPPTNSPPIASSPAKTLSIKASDQAILSEAAGKDTADLFTRKTVHCDFDKATNANNKRSTFDEQVCLRTAPANGALVMDSAKLTFTGKRNCSFDGPILIGSGTNTQTRSEVERIYGRAIDIAIKKGDIEAKVRIEALRDYTLRTISATASTDTVYANIRANGGGWPFGYKGFCTGYLTVDYIQLLP
jgi:hypothetical protein